MKKLSNIALFFVIMATVFIVLGSLMFNYFRGPVSSNEDKLAFEVTTGSTYYSIVSNLKEGNLIKSDTFFKFFVKLTKPEALEACVYYLDETMGVDGIIAEFEKGCSSNPDAINITFKEGLHMRKIAEAIENNTNSTKEDVYDLITDTNYLDELISEYWFLTNYIKNSELYYSLEGYLFPNTYEFHNEDVSVKEIFAVMLDQTDKILTPNKTEILENNYSMHEILTLASIIELEAGNANDRAGVAGVFTNRLTYGWSLGSDVTTYYAEKLDMHERDLYVSELNDENGYNTRVPSMAGKLPVGPICNPGKESIEAAISPTEHDYFYFVADKNGKTYFNKTDSEHNATVTDLKANDLWFIYE